MILFFIVQGLHTLAKFLCPPPTHKKEFVTAFKSFCVIRQLLLSVFESKQREILQVVSSDSYSPKFQKDQTHLRGLCQSKIYSQVEFGVEHQRFLILSAVTLLLKQGFSGPCCQRSLPRSTLLLTDSNAPSKHHRVHFCKTFLTCIFRYLLII